MVYKVQSKPYIIYNPTIIFRVSYPVTQIDQFMSRIGRKGGMSLTTGFDVFFDNLNSNVAGEFYSGGNEDIVHMLCDEAQLPNVQSATGQISGRYLGESAMQYPHSRMFTDLSLGFLCDAELTPLKFFTRWYDFIFGEEQETNRGYYFDARTAQPRPRNRTNRLKYMDDYVSNVKIAKTEPNATYSNGRAPVTFILENAYPYSIDAVPLSYGSSQIARVNVNFYYSRHTVSYGDAQPGQIRIPVLP